MVIDKNIQTINKEICKECGGKCCKNCGCSYSTDDFENMSFSSLKQELEKGHISITSLFIATKTNASYILTLRARNINRDIVDLFSPKTTCASLTEKGCKLEDSKRPQAGILYIPNKNGECKGFYTEETAFKEWSQYQKVLERLTRTFCGKSSQEKIKEDIIEVACYLASKEFQNVIDISQFTQEEKALWDTLNAIIPTYQHEVETGIHMAKKNIYR